MAQRLTWFEKRDIEHRRWQERERLNQINRDVAAERRPESDAVFVGDKLTQRQQESLDRVNKEKATFEEQQKRCASMLTWSPAGATASMNNYKSQSVREQSDETIRIAREAERAAQLEQERLAAESKTRADAAAAAKAKADKEEAFRRKHRGMSPLDVELENKAIAKTLTGVLDYDKVRIHNWIWDHADKFICDVSVKAAMAALGITPQF